MCELCDTNGGDYQGCQDCGRLICFDNQPNDVDVIDQAYVTASGDLFCQRCGVRYDRADEEYDDDLDFGWEIDPYDDGPMEFIEDDEP